MNYWMTTQWPNLIGQKDSLEAELYLADGFEKAGKYLAPGDHVLIYESQGGPTELVTLIGGTTKKVGRKTGKMGIVTCRSSRAFHQGPNHRPDAVCRSKAPDLVLDGQNDAVFRTDL